MRLPTAAIASPMASAPVQYPAVRVGDGLLTRCAPQFSSDYVALPFAGAIKASVHPPQIVYGNDPNTESMQAVPRTTTRALKPVSTSPVSVSNAVPHPLFSSGQFVGRAIKSATLKNRDGLINSPRHTHFSMAAGAALPSTAFSGRASAYRARAYADCFRR